MGPRSRGMVFVRVLQTRCPSAVRGRRESRALDAPVEIPVCRSTRVIATGTAGHPGFPRASGLAAYFVLSPVSGLYCHRCRCPHRRGGWTPGSRRQDHTTSPSAVSVFVRCRSPDAAAAHRIPCPTYRDDRETSLRWAWDGIANNVNRNSGKAKYF